jgi:hypothetical protein
LPPGLRGSDARWGAHFIRQRATSSEQESRFVKVTSPFVKAEQCHQRKVVCHIPAYKWIDFPLMVILIMRSGKFARLLSLYGGFFLWVSTSGGIIREVMERPQNNRPQFRPNAELKLMDQVREVLRDDRDAYRTEQPSGHGILRDLHDCGGKTPPPRRGTQEVERFLAHLATEGVVHRSKPASNRACQSQTMQRLWGSGRHIGDHQHGCHGMNSTELLLLKTVAMNRHRCLIGNFS